MEVPVVFNFLEAWVPTSMQYVVHSPPGVQLQLLELNLTDRVVVV
jgi:hypothetical protein